MSLNLHLVTKIPFNLKFQEKTLSGHTDHSAPTVTKTYDITRYNTDDLNTEKWNVLRGTRDLLIKNTDWIITQARNVVLVLAL